MRHDCLINILIFAIVLSILGSLIMVFADYFYTIEETSTYYENSTKITLTKTYYTDIYQYHRVTGFGVGLIVAGLGLIIYALIRNSD